MFKEILVPLDGTPLTERSLPYARAIARATGAGVRLALPALAVQPGGHDLMQGSRGYLTGIAGDLAAEGLRIETIVHPGDPTELVLEELEARRPDLLVLPLPVHAGLHGWVAVAEATLTRTPVPILLVPSWGTEGVAAPPRRLLVPLDGTPRAEAALLFATALAGRLAGEVVLVHAIAPDHRPQLLASAMDRDAVHEANAVTYLGEVARRAERDGCRVRTDVRFGSPAEAIAAAGRDHEAGFVVMAFDRRPGETRPRLGSVARGLLRRGGPPLLLVGARVVPSREITGAALADDVAAMSAAPRPPVPAGAPVEHRGATAVLERLARALRGDGGTGHRTSRPVFA